MNWEQVVRIVPNEEYPGEEQLRLEEEGSQSGSADATASVNAQPMAVDDQKAGADESAPLATSSHISARPNNRARPRTGTELEPITDDLARMMT